MQTYIKRIIMAVVVVGLLLAIGYGGYRAYNWAVDDATRKIKQGVKEGVGEGVGGAINPLTWPGKLFGG